MIQMDFVFYIELEAWKIDTVEKIKCKVILIGEETDCLFLQCSVPSNSLGVEGRINRIQLISLVIKSMHSDRNSTQWW